MNAIGWNSSSLGAKGLELRPKPFRRFSLPLGADLIFLRMSARCANRWARGEPVTRKEKPCGAMPVSGRLSFF